MVICIFVYKFYGADTLDVPAVTDKPFIRLTVVGNTYLRNVFQTGCRRNRDAVCSTPKGRHAFL